MADNNQQISLSGLVAALQQGNQALNSIQQALVGLGLLQWVPAPALASSPGIAGQISYDATHFYVCVAASTWVRVVLATF